MNTTRRDINGQKKTKKQEKKKKKCVVKFPYNKSKEDHSMNKNK
jgi:hypothetical protein